MSYSVALSVVRSKHTWAVVRLLVWLDDARRNKKETESKTEKYKALQDESISEQFLSVVLKGKAVGFLTMAWSLACFFYWKDLYDAWQNQNPQLKSGPLSSRVLGLFTEPESQRWSNVEIACMATASVGTLLRWWAKRTLGKYFTYDLSVWDDHYLIMEGPYSMVRHPGYTGSLLMVLGDGIIPALFRHSPMVFLGNALVTFAVLSRIPKEDQVLREHFGRDAEEWQKRTWKLVPYVW